MPILINKHILTCKRVAEEIISKLYKISIEDINDTSRMSRNANARFAVFLILHRKYRMNFSLIGQLYGKHYSSVRYGIDRAIFLGLLANVNINEKKEKGRKED